jgi:hypothetical protein
LQLIALYYNYYIIQHGFFQFYAHDFPQCTTAVSIRHFPNVVPKTRSDKPLLWRLCIEDPFETFDSHMPHDLGIHINFGGQQRIHAALHESLVTLTNACACAHHADGIDADTRDSLLSLFQEQEPVPDKVLVPGIGMDMHSFPQLLVNHTNTTNPAPVSRCTTRSSSAPPMPMKAAIRARTVPTRACWGTSMVNANVNASVLTTSAAAKPTPTTTSWAALAMARPRIAA